MKVSRRSRSSSSHAYKRVSAAAVLQLSKGQKAILTVTPDYVRVSVYGQTVIDVDVSLLGIRGPRLPTCDTSQRDVEI